VGGRRLYLLLKRLTAAGTYWQPVTGSLEEGETHSQAAIREVFEETGLTAFEDQLIDLKLTNEFEIAPEWIAKYPPGVTRNTEVCFALEVEKLPVRLDEIEHQAYLWAEYKEALEMVHYESNRRALMAAEELIPGPRKCTPYS
jgi:dATP pyrophosphohydrolase